MENNTGTAYRRTTVSLNVSGSMDDVYPSAIRKAITADGLYDDQLAHNHGSDGKTVACTPSVLFRKGNQHSIVLVGIGEGSDYLTSKPIPIGKSIRLAKSNGDKVDVTINGGSVRRYLDAIRIGGFHQYETDSPIIVAKSGAKMMEMILGAADSISQTKLITTCIARQVRGQIARMQSVDVKSVPRIRVVFDGYPVVRNLELKDKVFGVAVRGEFGMNVDYTGGRYGVGLGLYTTTGYGIIRGSR